MKSTKTSSKNKDEVLNRITKISSLIRSGNPKGVIEEIKRLETEFPNDPTLQLNKPGFLIDSGCDLVDVNVVKEGIQAGEKNLKEDRYKNHLAILHYNIANGYLALYGMIERSQGVRATPQSENLQKAKQHLRQASQKHSPNDANLATQIWTNLGNCLDTLGRSVEAIQAYDKALGITKGFPMAVANRAVAFKAFAGISGKYRGPIYVEAYQDILSVINNANLVAIGGQQAKSDFELHLKSIESLFSDKSLLQKKVVHPKYKSDKYSDFEKFYLELCSKEKLFLNLHIHQDHCEAAIEDPVFIRLITKVDDNDTFFNLAKYLNQIKEDYAVARLLLVQSQYKQKDFDNISKRTSYANTQDYADFNLYVGLLKSAFKEAFNVLDKIAVFVNSYYQLDLDEEKITFGYVKGQRGASVWEDNNCIRSEIDSSQNRSLYALYDIHQDFKTDVHQRIKDIRNALTHRKLVVFDSVLTDWDSKTDKHNIGYDTMLNETIELMRLVKAAIIYLINFVNAEEEKKRGDSGSLIIDMPVDTNQFL